jgi:hypothetical protein
MTVCNEQGWTPRTITDALLPAWLVQQTPDVRASWEAFCRHIASIENEAVLDDHHEQNRSAP